MILTPWAVAPGRLRRVLTGDVGADGPFSTFSGPPVCCARGGSGRRGCGNGTGAGAVQGVVGGTKTRGRP
nr:hypothetical protein KitaXyl93_07370 [Kitasatospora sp. Xyl93]